MQSCGKNSKLAGIKRVHPISEVCFDTAFNPGASFLPALQSQQCVHLLLQSKACWRWCAVLQRPAIVVCWESLQNKPFLKPASVRSALPHRLWTMLYMLATTLCHSPYHALAKSKYISRTLAMILCLHRRWLH